MFVGSLSYKINFNINAGYIQQSRNIHILVALHNYPEILEKPAYWKISNNKKYMSGDKKFYFIQKYWLNRRSIRIKIQTKLTLQKQWQSTSIILNYHFAQFFYFGNVQSDMSDGPYSFLLLPYIL